MASFFLFYVFYVFFLVGGQKFGFLAIYSPVKTSPDAICTPISMIFVIKIPDGIKISIFRSIYDDVQDTRAKNAL